MAYRTPRPPRWWRDANKPAAPPIEQAAPATGPSERPASHRFLYRLGQVLAFLLLVMAGVVVLALGGLPRRR